MNRRTTAIALATAGTLLATGPLALAATHRATPKGGAIQLWSTAIGDTTSKVTFTGAIGDYGKLLQTNRAGKPDPNGAYEHAALKHGTLVIDASALGKKTATTKPKINAANCSVTFIASGPAKITSGTGEYAGAHGTLNVTLAFAGIAPKKKGGGCDLSDSAPSYGAYGAVTGSGSVSFSS